MELRGRSGLRGIGDGADDTGGVTCGDGIGWDIFSNYGAGADNDAVTQGDPFENDGASANKAATADFYWFRYFGIFVEPRESGAEVMKVCIQNHGASS